MDYKDYEAGVDGQHFWFKAKNGLIDVLLSKAIRTDNTKILNVGVGTGDDLVTIKKHGALYVLDVDQQALDMIPQGLVVEKKLADACAIPYPDNSFDVVVAFDVMEHVDDDKKMVSEIYRVLKPGGHYIFTVPAFNFLFSGHDCALGHVRRYNKKMTKTLLGNFTKITTGYWLFFLFFPAALVRLINKKSQTSSMSNVPDWLNTFFYKLLALENWFIVHGLTFPFGLTLYGVYKK